MHTQEVPSLACASTTLEATTAQLSVSSAWEPPGQQGSSTMGADASSYHGCDISVIILLRKLRSHQHYIFIFHTILEDCAEG